MGETVGARRVGVALVVFSALAVAGATGGTGPPARWGSLRLADDAAIARAGAELRSAVVAHDTGDLDAAEKQLLAIGERHPVIADYADLLRMRLLIERGRTAQALEMRTIWRHEDSPLEAEFYQLLGDALAAEGDERGARGAWAAAIEAGEAEELRAALHLAIGRSLEREGDAEGAAAEWIRVWRSYPLSDAAGAAEEGIAALEEARGESLRKAGDWRRHGDALYRSRRNEEALAAYERTLASPDLSRSEKRRASRQRAETLFRLRRYDDAAEAFAALPASDEVRIEWARSLARAGKVKQGAAALERIGRDSRTWHGARATLLAALLWEDDDPERAQALFAQLTRRFSRTRYAASASWRLGWAAYRERRFADAAREFERLAERERDPVSSLRARYWHARALEESGDESAADAFAQIAQAFPLTYYGWRSRSRAAGDRAEPEAAAIERGDVALSPSELARPRILLEAGLIDEARVELDLLFARVGGLDDRLAVAELYANAGEYNRAQRLVVSAYRETLARGPRPVDIELWWHAWPLPFADEVRGAGTSVPPELVYALMREESGYRPRVVSISGARGLLQLMPTTAERVARDAGLPQPSLDDLFEPRVNIRLGSTYLETLLGRFEGRAPPAIASYNAGPEAVGRWMEGGVGAEDEWVESIPYEQTRTYVKRVLRSLHAYQVLY